MGPLTTTIRAMTQQVHIPGAVRFFTNSKAAKYHIELNVALEIKKKNSLVIEVCDNGCGIQKDNLSNIFDPFYSTKPSKEGIGLGLYICRTFAEQMGAQIEVESEPGKGSTFRLIHFVNDNKNNPLETKTHLIDSIRRLLIAGSFFFWPILKISPAFRFHRLPRQYGMTDRIICR
jgi:DNA topoisomerase VI subunit B